MVVKLKVARLYLFPLNRVKLRRVTATRNIEHILGETGQLLSSTSNASATVAGQGQGLVCVYMQCIISDV